MTRTLRPTPKQWSVIQAIRSRKYRYILFGGAMSGGKSYLLAMIFLSMAMQFARTRYGVFRRNRPALLRTTYQTFRKVAIEMGLVEGLDFKVNRADLMWEFANGSQLWFMELDETKDQDFNKVKGLELTAAGVDEANEVTHEAILVVSSRVGRENRNGELAFVFMTCNPDKNWVDEYYYTPWTEDRLQSPYLFVQALPSDNPHNTAEYLKALNEMPAAFRIRYVEGNWRYINDPNALFPMRLIDMATVEHVPSGSRRSSAADVAREGDDNNVFSLIIENTLADLALPDIEIGDEIPILNQVADEFVRYLKTNKVGYELAWVDGVGLGAGVVDNCRAKGYFVHTYKSGETKNLPLHPCAVCGSRGNCRHGERAAMYDMQRSQSYWEAAQAMQSGDLKIWRGLPYFEELRRDLLAHTYAITDKQICVEPKTKMKKRLHRSPDYSDAFVMAHHPNHSDGPPEIFTSGSYDDWFDDDKD